MAYFGQMKEAQLGRRFHGVKETEKDFLDGITWNNLRCGVCGFVHFATHLLETLPSKIARFVMVAILVSNQSTLECEFSAIRADDHDRGDTIGGHITNKCVKQGNAAQQRSRSYTSADCANKKKQFVTKILQFTAYARGSTKKLEEWLINHKKSLHSNTKSMQELSYTNKLL